MSENSSTGYGFGRALVAVYAVFAISATARSIYQLVAKADEALVAYLLSALAGLVYIVATWALATGNRKVAAFAIGFELIGVLGVGLLTMLDPELFPAATVWSRFGAGYGYVPLVLPFIGLWWLLFTGRRERDHVADNHDRR